MNNDNCTVVLQCLVENLILHLDELSKYNVITPFNEGEIIAFAECLEIVSKWSDFEKFGIPDIEKTFRIM